VAVSRPSLGDRHVTSTVASDVGRRIALLCHRLGLSPGCLGPPGGHLPERADHVRTGRRGTEEWGARANRKGRRKLGGLAPQRAGPAGTASGASRVGGGPAKAPCHLARSDPAPARDRDAGRAWSEMKRDAARRALPDRSVDRLLQFGGGGVTGGARMRHRGRPLTLAIMLSMTTSELSCVMRRRMRC
jgi:hypothetical protein